MSLVLDSSVTLAWLYSDETTDSIRMVFDLVADHGAIVPSLWRLEVANSLTGALRRRRIDAEFRRAALADLGRSRCFRGPLHGFQRLERDAGSCRSVSADRL
jgi:predicted nucleic acid-binding protein